MKHGTWLGWLAYVALVGACSDASDSDNGSYAMENVALKQDLVIPAGKTVHVGPGTVFQAAGADVKVHVLGELIVEGSAEAPASFEGGGAPRSWHGIVIESGGSLKLSHAHVGGATYGVFAMPGSTYTIEDSSIDTSFKAAVLQSTGTITRTKFTATAPPTFSVADDVSVDDPNGTVTIMDASPTVTESSFDGNAFLTDMVRIGGNSSPTFDRVYLHGAHCGFHTSGGTNTSAKITNAVLEGLAYGIMAYSTKPIVENSVFRDNATDIGICNGAKADNAPALKNNFYGSGELKLDASCFKIGTTDAAPAASANTNAGTSTK